MTGTVITKKGVALIAKLLATKQQLVFTRAAVGTGSCHSGYDPASMIDLNQYRMDGMISDYWAEGQEATVVFQISSANVEEGFIITEAGLYAEDKDEGEVLYAYLSLTDDPQYVYAKGSAIEKFAEIEFKTIIGSIENVTAIISPLALVTRELFDKGMETKSGIVVMKEYIPVSERRHNTWYLNVTDTQSYRAIKTNRALGFRIIGEEDAICQT